MLEEQLIIERVAPAQPDSLQTLVTLSKRLVELDTQIEDVSKNLVTLNEQRKDLAERTLPDLLTSTGLTEFTLNTGQKIKVKTDYYANISKDRAPVAYQWLRDHNMTSIIKEVLVVPTGLKKNLEEFEIPFSSTESVHASTLKALVKEQALAGTPLPADIFGVHIANQAVVE